MEKFKIKIHTCRSSGSNECIQLYLEVVHPLISLLHELTFTWGPIVLPSVREQSGPFTKNRIWYAIVIRDWLQMIPWNNLFPIETSKFPPTHHSAEIPQPWIRWHPKYADLQSPSHCPFQSESLRILLLIYLLNFWIESNGITAGKFFTTWQRRWFNDLVNRRRFN